MGLAAVRTFHDDLRPLLDVTFVDDDLHEAGITALLAAGRRRLSLVDWVSFTECVAGASSRPSPSTMTSPSRGSPWCRQPPDAPSHLGWLG